MFKCNYLDNLKDKTFQKLMITWKVLYPTKLFVV